MAISELKLPAGVGLQVWGSAAEQARGLAAEVAGRLRSALAEQGQALLVVSGGRSPVAFLEALSEEPLDWSRITSGSSAKGSIVASSKLFLRLPL